MRHHLRRVGLVLAYLLALLACCEFAARRIEQRLGMFYYASYDGGGTPWATTAFRPSQQLGWEHVPNVYDFNSLGFRNPEYPQDKNQKIYRVALLGDSLAESYGNDLREHIQTRWIGAKKIELWNMGVGSYNIAQIASMLELRGMQYHPNLVVLFICLKDLDPGIPTLYKTKKHLLALVWQGTAPFALAFHPLWPHCAFYRLIALRNLQRKMNEPPHHPLPRREIFGAEQLARIQTLCRRKNVPLVAFLFPYLKPLRDYSPDQRSDYGIWLSLLRKKGIRYFDLHARFDGRATLGMRDTPGDYIHLNAPSRREAMRRVYDILHQEYFVRLSS